MKHSFKNRILEAIERGLDHSLQFELDKYVEDDSNDIYILKKKVDLDKDDKSINAKFNFSKYVKKLITTTRLLTEEIEEIETAIVLGCLYTPANKEELKKIIVHYCQLSGWVSDLNWIDTSKIKDMSYLFCNSLFHGDISKWNTSNVTNMEYMFLEAYDFNSDISDWDVSHVTNMNNMFEYASSFNQPIGDWDVSNVEDLNYLFHSARSFNQDLSKWHFNYAVMSNYAFLDCPISEDFIP